MALRAIYGRIYNYTLQQDLNFFNYNFRVLDYCEIKERKNYTNKEETCTNTTINANVSFYYEPIFELLYVNDNCSYLQELYELC